MNFSFTAEEEKFKEEVLQFFKKEATPDVMAETEDGHGLPGPQGDKMLQKMGQKAYEKAGNFSCGNFKKRVLSFFQQLLEDYVTNP